MKYNKDMKLEHLPKDKLGFYVDSKGGAVCLTVDDMDYVVSSFEQDGHCNNAAGYRDSRKAWDLFTSIVRDDL